MVCCLDALDAPRGSLNFGACHSGNNAARNSGVKRKLSGGAGAADAASSNGCGS